MVSKTLVSCKVYAVFCVQYQLFLNFFNLIEVWHNLTYSITYEWTCFITEKYVLTFKDSNTLNLNVSVLRRWRACFCVCDYEFYPGWEW